MIFKADAEPEMRSHKADTFLHGLLCIWWLHINLGACQQEAMLKRTVARSLPTYMHACFMKMTLSQEA